MFIIISES